MRNFVDVVKGFLADESGVAMTELGLLLGFVAIACTAVGAALSGAFNGVFARVVSSL